MATLTTLVSAHANSDIPHPSLQQSPIQRLTQRILQRGDTLRLAPCKCRNCLVCRADDYNRKTDMRRRRALSRVQMQNPCIITLTPENPAHPEIGQLIGEAIRRLKRSGLCTESYIWQAEVGRQSGRLHLHMLIDARATVAVIRAGLDAWHDNRKEQFCSKHSGINVERYEVLSKAINYVLKSNAAPVDAEGWNRLPHRTFGKSQDIDLSPRNKRRASESTNRRSPNDYAPRTWASRDCGHRVEAATIKKDTFFVSDAIKLECNWDECRALFGASKGDNKINLQGNDAEQALLYLASNRDFRVTQQSATKTATFRSE